MPDWRWQSGLTRALELRRVAAASHVGVQPGQVGGGRGGGGGAHPGHAEGGEGAPGRGDGLRLGQEREVDLHLPALVHLGRAAVAAGGPGAVGDPDQIGAATHEGRVSGSADLIRIIISFACSLPNYISYGCYEGKSLSFSR